MFDDGGMGGDSGGWWDNISSGFGKGWDSFQNKFNGLFTGAPQGQPPGYSTGFGNMTGMGQQPQQLAGPGMPPTGGPTNPQEPEGEGGGGLGSMAAGIGQGVLGTAPLWAQLFKGGAGGNKAGGGMMGGAPAAGSFAQKAAPDARAVQGMLANKQAMGIYDGGAVSPETLANVMGTDTYSPEFIQQIMRGGGRG